MTRVTSLRRRAFTLVLTCCEVAIRALAKITDEDQAKDRDSDTRALACRIRDQP